MGSWYIDRCSAVQLVILAETVECKFFIWVCGRGGRGEGEKDGDGRVLWVVGTVTDVQLSNW